MSDGSRVLSLAAATGGGRLRQLDALRVITCLSVVAVHSIGGPYPPDVVGIGAATSILHYSREIFFFVSALVLVRTYVPRLGPEGRLPDEGAFRRRRLRLIGVPYLVWTTIYFVVWIWHVRSTQPVGPILDDMPLRWVYLVVTGNGCYHMYFLLVTLQFAVVFPLFLRILGRTQGRHGWVLAASLVAQVATLSIYHWVALPDEGWRMVLGDSSLFAYQLWLVAGALAGLHLERVHDWLTSHKALVILSVPVALVALLWNYYAHIPSMGVLEASTPLQPMMIVWSAVTLAALYLLANRFASMNSTTARAVFGYGAQLSFGVYLVHPLVLDMVLSMFRRIGVFAASPWIAAVAFLLTAAGAVVMCTVLHRTRFALPLLGRSRIESGHMARIWAPDLRPQLAATSALMLLAAAAVLVAYRQAPTVPTQPGGLAITVGAETVQPDGNVVRDVAGR
jgi:peptidoglycan/LPS O-acetylase OafA/YrhL